MDAPPGVTWSATAIAAAVRAGRLDPRSAVESSLEAIAARNDEVEAFIIVRHDRARAEAAALAEHPDLATLPLAGVPVAIKDNVDVTGEPTRHGSAAYDDRAATQDHPTVARLRAAGAVVVGKTHVPELSCWGSTEGGFGSPRNPWNRTRSAGGSSGGSAAAVASAMVPIALGNDGMGSIRIPAAACGVFGIKPGPGLVPAELGSSSWFGMSENGPLATCVQDARAMLAVLSGDDSLTVHTTPAPRLRIALSTRPPVVGTRVAASWRAAVAATGELLAGAGHTVRPADPPYQALDALTLGARWTAGIAQDAEGLDPHALERRTRGHIRFGKVLRAAGFEHERWRHAWAKRLEEFFDDHDVLITPTLAQAPPPLRGGHRRSWWSNVWRDANFAPFPARFNLGAVPAASVPAGHDHDGLPVAVQLVAWRGGEATLLAVAQQLEELRPWSRHPASFAPPMSV